MLGGLNQHWQSAGRFHPNSSGGVLVFFCITTEAEFSCFRRYFVATFVSQLEEILESGKGLGRFTLPVQVGLIESLTPLDAD